MSLRKLLSGLTGEPDQEDAGRQKPASARARPTPSLFPAVTVVPGKPCCQAATLLSKSKILAREAPPLPLPTCSMSDECTCTFNKFKDRRDSERRTFGFDERRLWSAAEEFRQSRGRRKSDR